MNTDTRPRIQSKPDGLMSMGITTLPRPPPEPAPAPAPDAGRFNPTGMAGRRLVMEGCDLKSTTVDMDGELCAEVAATAASATTAAPVLADGATGSATLDVGAKRARTRRPHSDGIEALLSFLGAGGTGSVSASDASMAASSSACTAASSSTRHGSPITLVGVTMTVVSGAVAGTPTAKVPEGGCTIVGLQASAPASGPTTRSRNSASSSMSSASAAPITIGEPMPSEPEASMSKSAAADPTPSSHNASPPNSPCPGTSHGFLSPGAVGDGMPSTKPLRRDRSMSGSTSRSESGSCSWIGFMPLPPVLPPT